MRSDHATAWLTSAALATFVAVAAPASHAQSCLDNATSVQEVAAGTADYAFSSGRAADGANGIWSNVSDGIEFTGSPLGCWVNGTFDGPFAENACYECTSEHGYPGCSCVGSGYHTTSAMRPDGPKPIAVEDAHLKDYGDGISVGEASGDVVARRVWFQDLHDDAMETDYAQQSLSCNDCLFDKVFMAQAYRRRSSASSGPKAGLTMELRNSLVRVHRFSSAYKQKPGHGGVYKDDGGFEPRFIVTDNVFLMGPVSGGQKQFPTASATAECRNNVVLWQGTESAYQDMLADESNGANLAALGHCYRVVKRQSSQTEAAFRAAQWDPLVAQWKASHAAAGGTPAPGPNPAPGPVPGPDPDPGPGSPPQAPILLPSDGA